MISNEPGNSKEKLLTMTFRRTWIKIVSVLASLVVFVTTYALILPAITMSSQQTFCGYEEHEHTAECYNAEGELICGLEEHIHTLACYSDMYAEIENEELWRAEVPELTGDRNADVIAVARSLINYRESDKNYLVSDDDQTQGYSRFGHWYGDMVDRVLRETADEVTAEIISEIDAELAADATGDVAKALYNEIDAYVASQAAAPAAVEAEGSTEETVLPKSITVPDDIITGIADYVSGNITVDRADEISRFVAGLRAADIAARIPARITEKMIGINPAEIAEGHVERLANGLPAHSYKDWDAMFVSYVLHYAQITDFGAETDAGNWSGALAASGKYVDAAGYVPEAGDLIFFTPYAGANVQVGIVSDVNKNLLGFGNEIKSVSVILGNSDNSVAEVKVAVDEYNEGDMIFETIHGYGVLTPRDPEAEEPEDTSHADSIVDYLAGLISPGAPEDETVADEAAAENGISVEEDLSAQAADSDASAADVTKAPPADESTVAGEVTVPADESTVQTAAKTVPVETDGDNAAASSDEATANAAAKVAEQKLPSDESTAAADDKSPTAPDNSKASEDIDSIGNETVGAEKDDETSGAEAAVDTEVVIDTEEASTAVEILENGLSEDGTAIIMNWQVTAQLPENVLPADAIIRVDTATGKVHAMTIAQAKEWAGTANVGGESVAFVDNDNYEVTFVGDNGRLYTWADVQAVNDNAAVTFTGVQVRVLGEVTFAEGRNTVEFGFATTAKIENANIGFNYYVTKANVNGCSGAATHIYENGEAVQVDQNKILQDAGLEEETTSFCGTKTLTAEGTDFTVTMTYGSDAGIPDTAKLYVKEIRKGTKEYDNYMAETKASLGISEDDTLELYGRFFDIRIITKAGEFEPKAAVRVDIDYEKIIEDVEESDVEAVHFADEGTEILECDPSGTNGNISGVGFDSESFSIYGVVYTVDFSYGGYIYSVSGKEQIALSELVEILGIAGNSESSVDAAGREVSAYADGSEFVQNVTDVTVTLVQQNDEDVDPGEVYVERTEDDWLIKNDVAFGNVYELAVIMNDGNKYVITVTDATYGYYDLEDWASSISVTVQEGQSDSSVTKDSDTAATTTSTTTSTLYLEMGYSISGSTGGTYNIRILKNSAQDGYIRLYYDLSDIITDKESVLDISGNGDLYNDGVVVGTYTVSGGFVLLDIDASTVDRTATEANGTFELALVLDSTQTESDGAVTYDFPRTLDDITVTYPDKSHISGTKTVDTTTSTVYATDGDDEYLTYTYTLTVEGDEGVSALNLTDYIPDGMTLESTSVSVTRNYTTTPQVSTRTCNGVLGVFSSSRRNIYDMTAWSEWTTDTTESTVTGAETADITLNGTSGTVTGADILTAFGLSSADTVSAVEYTAKNTEYSTGNRITSNNATEKKRTVTHNVYEITYTARVSKADAYEAAVANGGSVEYTNSVEWSDGTETVDGGEATVTVNAGELEEGTKTCVDGDTITVENTELLTDDDGNKYVLITYRVSITEPIDADSVVLTDVLSRYQALCGNTGTLYTSGDDAQSRTVTLTAEGADSDGKGGTITFDLSQVLSDQFETSFKANTTYTLEYQTKVLADDFEKDITNESSWVIDETDIPGEDETVIVEKMPYEQGSKSCTTTDNHVVGDGLWTLDWEIKTYQYQDANDVTVTDTYSSDQEVVASSFSIWINGTEYSVTEYSSLAAHINVDNSSHTFTVSFDKALKAVLGTSEDPAFKANTEYKITYSSITSQYDADDTVETEKSDNESTWTFDGTSDDPSTADITLVKDEYEAGSKMVKCSEGTGTGNYVTNGAAEVEYVTIDADDDKIDLSYQITLNEPMGGEDLTKAQLVDSYSSYETVDEDSFAITVNGTTYSVAEEYIDINAASHTFTVDFVTVLTALGLTFEADTDYVLTYNTYITLDDTIKAALKATDSESGELIGLTVNNNQSWTFDGANGEEEKNGNETEYTFTEKTYNGGSKSVTVTDTQTGEAQTETGTNTACKNDQGESSVEYILVDRAENTLNYTITLTENRNSDKVVLHDVFSGTGVQTLDTNSFVITFTDDSGDHTITNVSSGLTYTSLTAGFDLDLTAVLTANCYTFTEGIEYTINYTTKTTTVGNIYGTGTEGTDAADGFDNGGTWEFDNGDGTGDVGITETHLALKDCNPGTKSVSVREQAGTTYNSSSDWQKLSEGNDYSDSSSVTSHVVETPTESNPVHLDYTITINESRAIDTAVLTDTFWGSADQTLDTESFTLMIDDDGPYTIPSSYITVTSDGGSATGFTMDFIAVLTYLEKTFEEDVNYIISYTTTTTTVNNIEINGDGADNEAIWTLNGAEVQGGHTETHLKKVTYVDKQYYNVTDDADNTEAGGDVEFGDTLKYVITVGESTDDLRGTWIKDTMMNLQNIDTDKGIIVADADGNPLVDLINDTVTDGWYWSLGSQSAYDGGTTDIFTLTFPNSYYYTEAINGPVTITYYVTVTDESDYVSAVGRTTTDVTNTVSIPDATITVDYELSVGSVTIKKEAVEVDPDDLGSSSVSTGWTIKVTPDNTTLKGIKIVDYPCRLSTNSADDAESGTNSTDMSIDAGSVTVTYVNAGDGHEAGAAVDTSYYRVYQDWNNSGHWAIEFISDIYEEVLVTFNTTASVGYTGKNIYFYNQAVLKDSSNNEVSEPDTATSEYESDGSVTAEKTFLEDETDIENGIIYWQITVKTEGNATMYGAYVAETLAKYSTTEVDDWTNNGTTMVYYWWDQYKDAIVTDSEGNVLTIDEDYKIESNVDGSNHNGIKFYTRITGPVYIKLPLSLTIGSGYTYVHNEAVVGNSNTDPVTVTADGTIENYDLPVTKAISSGTPTYPNFSEEVTYTLNINPDKLTLPDGTPTITDILPAGMTYVEDSLTYRIYGSTYNTWGDVNESGSYNYLWVDPDITTETLDDDRTQETMTIDFSKLTSIDFSLSGHQIYMTYKAKLTDSEIERLQTIGTNVTQVYANNATVTQGGVESDPATVSWDYTYEDALQKEDVTADYINGRQNVYLYYKVTINKDARELNGGNTLVVTDKITTDMELVRSSVKVVQVVDGVETDVTDDDDISISYDGIYRTLTVRVPDNTTYYLTFRTKIEDPQINVSQTFTNTVNLSGESEWSASVTEDHMVVTTSGTFVSNLRNGFYIYKIDGNDITTMLEGAEFTLYKATYDENYVLTGTDDSFTPVVVTSNSKGIATFEDLELETLYYWIETETPENYTAENYEEPQYVVLYSNDSETDDNGKTSYERAKELDNNIQDANGIIVNTAVEGYQWTVDNVDKKQFTVTKVWDDDDNADRPTSVTVQLYQDETAYGDTVTITENTNGDWTYTWYDLPATVDGTECYYSVKETDTDEAYTAVYKKVTGGMEITNRLKDETKLLIMKEWEDNDNASSLRPGSITVKLYRLETKDGTTTTTLMKPSTEEDSTDVVVAESDDVESEIVFTLSAANDWQISVSGLATEGDDGEAYSYFVVEDDVENYTASYESEDGTTVYTTSDGVPAGKDMDGDGILTVTNTLSTVKATKKWLDANGDETWVKDVTFKLMKKNTTAGTLEDVTTPSYYTTYDIKDDWSQTKTVTTENRTAVWDHLDELDSGYEYFAVELSVTDAIEYTREDPTDDSSACLTVTVDGTVYDVTGGTISNGTGTIVNAPRTDFELEKEWAGLTSASDYVIQIQLRRYSKTTGKVDETFNYSADEASDNGTEYHEQGQTFTLDGTAVRYLTDETTLYAEETESGSDESGNSTTWGFKWYDLPLADWDSNGEAVIYEYRVDEVAVYASDDTEFVKDLSDSFIQSYSSSGTTISFTNMEACDIQVTKAWNGENTGNVTAIDYVLHQIYTKDEGSVVDTEYTGTYTNMIEYHEAVEATDDTEAVEAYWDTVEIENLPKYIYDEDDSKWYELFYYVEETIPDGAVYSASYKLGDTKSSTASAVTTNDDTETLTIVNSESAEFSFNKTWMDSNENSANSVEWPDDKEITITLYGVNDSTGTKGETIRTYTLTNESSEEEDNLYTVEVNTVTMNEKTYYSYTFTLTDLSSDYDSFYVMEGEVDGYSTVYGSTSTDTDTGEVTLTTGNGKEYAGEGEYIVNQLVKVALPSTGGPGTTAIYLLGFMLIATSAFGCFAVKHKKIV